MSRTEPDHYYFLGIAGQVMSGLAIALQRQGYRVNGVAVNAYPPSTDALHAASIRYFPTYQARHIKRGMKIVLANDIKADNPELVQARKLDLDILSFPQLLEQIRGDETRIVISGTHGKTTTTTLIAWMLECANRHPDFVIGMFGHNLGQSVRLDGAPIMVMEGDEYGSSILDTRSKFSFYHPDILVITSLEWDHPDLFSSFKAIRQRYLDLITSLPSDKTIVACADDPHVTSLLANCPNPVIWYGRSTKADWRASAPDLSIETTFTLTHQDESRTITSPLAGIHNIQNVAAAIIVARQLKLPWAAITQAIQTFSGAARRFELVGQVNNITIIDDYAHHPTEIAATLKAAKARYTKERFAGKLWAYVVPHTFSRTKALLPAYATCFAAADTVLLGPIDPSREYNLAANVSSDDIVATNTTSAQIIQVATPDQAIEMLANQLQPGDAVVCMTVGNAGKVPQQLVLALEQKWLADHD